MIDLNLRKGFLYLLIASVSVSALIGIAVIIIGQFGEFESKVLGTSAIITTVSILGLACGVFLETGRGRIVPFAGIGFSIISGVMWIILIWAEGDNETFGKALLSVTLLSFALALTSLLSLARLDSRFAWSLHAVRALISVGCGIVLYIVWFHNDPPDWVTRTLGVIGILIAALTVTIPIFHRLSSHELSNSEIDSQIEELRRRIGELEKSRK